MKTENPTPFEDLNNVLKELTKSVQAILGDNLVGLYLQGSFGMGDFDEHSDVDFLAIIQQEVTEAELAALQRMHQRIFANPTPWAQHLEGSYFPLEMLKRYDPVADQPFYIDNGSQKLVRSDHDNSWVVRWTTRQCGVALAGPSAKELIDPIPSAAMHNEVLKTMQDWGEEIVTGKYKIENRWAQPFAALSYGRMLHTLSTGQIHSKLAAVQWAKSNLADEWVGLLERAWVERPFPSQKVHQAADPDEVAQTINFIRHAINGQTAVGKL